MENNSTISQSVSQSHTQLDHFMCQDPQHALRNKILEQIQNENKLEWPSSENTNVRASLQTRWQSKMCQL